MIISGKEVTFENKKRKERNSSPEKFDLSFRHGAHVVLMSSNSNNTTS